MAQIVLEVPDTCKSLLAVIPDVVARLAGIAADTTASKDVDYVAVEREVAAQCARLECAAHRDTLAAMDVTEPWVSIGGVVHRRVLRAPQTYYTLAGPITLTRSLFRPDKARGGKAVDPIAARVGMVDGRWLPGTAKAMAFLLQQGTAREAAASAAQLHRLPYCRNSFDAVGHAVGQHVRVAHQEVEQALIEAFEVPAEAHAIGVSLDRGSVPIEEPKPRPKGRPRKGATRPRRSVQRVFRMAYCATITLTDAKGEAIHTIRYGRMPEKDVSSLLDSMQDDVLALLRKRPELDVVLLCDGAAEPWGLLEARFHAGTLGKEPVRLVDLWHLVEKLGKAARVKHGGEARAVSERWKARLLNDSGSAAKIRAEVASWGLEWHAEGADHPVHEALTFLSNQGEAGRLDYATARSRGLPVGSGAVEATCKSLFGVRMKRPGARWHQETAEDVITLRALALSDRWDGAVDLTLRLRRREVKLAA